MKRFLLLAISILAINSAALAHRLPGNVVPESYDLKFEPSLSSATFSGEETIHVRLQKPASAIVLNSAEIEFLESTVTAEGSTQTASVKIDGGQEFATLTVSNSIPAGPADIHIRFTGLLNDKLRGFYLSRTERRRYAVTQFESTDARRAFPSFDEPAYKSVFHITLVIDKSDTAISNGRITSDTPGPGAAKHTIEFSTSPKMSTYLVAMMVGDFRCLSGGADGIPIRVCAVPEKKDLLSFALISTERILKFYNRYFSMKYPFQKLDIIALPDFAAGAMENTAAITFRETLLTINDKTASVNSHQTVVNVIAHEMAHQWFGDLVTMKWWDDIWLNEGFATWMSTKPIKAWKPEWHEELEEIKGTSSALFVDSIASVRPIRAKAETPAEIQDLFDGIAYGKAASVLRMVEAWVGPEVFRKGVNAYLEKHAYANATAEDFWSQLTTTSGKPVDKVMASFTEQSGAPLVSVKTTCRANTTQVTLYQERYFADSARLAAGSSELWQIPLSLRAAGSKTTSYKLMTEREEAFELPGCSPWVYANAGGRGLFRSAYDPATLAKISAELETTFSPEDRIHFLLDVWSLVRVGRVSIADYLATIEKMQGERSRAVVSAMIGHIPGIHDNIALPADRTAFEAWVRGLFRPIADAVGDSPKRGESDKHQGLRSDVFETLARYGRDPRFVEKARAIVDAYMTAPDTVDAAMAEIALKVSAQNGDSALYDKYIAHLKTSRTPEEYHNYLSSIGAFPDLALVKRAFEFALSPEVKSQDIFLVLDPLRYPDTQAAAWEIFKANFSSIIAKAGPAFSGDFAHAQRSSVIHNYAMTPCSFSWRRNFPTRIGPFKIHWTRSTPASSSDRCSKPTFQCF